MLVLAGYKTGQSGFFSFFRGFGHLSAGQDQITDQQTTLSTFSAGKIWALFNYKKVPWYYFVFGHCIQSN